MALNLDGTGGVRYFDINRMNVVLLIPSDIKKAKPLIWFSLILHLVLNRQSFSGTCRLKRFYADNLST